MSKRKESRGPSVLWAPWDTIRVGKKGGKWGEGNQLLHASIKKTYGQTKGDPVKGKNKIIVDGVHSFSGESARREDQTYLDAIAPQGLGQQRESVGINNREVKIRSIWIPNFGRDNKSQCPSLQVQDQRIIETLPDH